METKIITLTQELLHTHPQPSILDIITQTIKEKLQLKYPKINIDTQTHVNHQIILSNTDINIATIYLKKEHIVIDNYITHHHKCIIDYADPEMFHKITEFLDKIT